MTSIPVYLLSLSGKVTNYLAYKAVEKLRGESSWYPSPSVDPVVSVETDATVVHDRASSTEDVPDHVSFSEDAPVSVETQEEEFRTVGFEDNNKDNEDEDDDFNDDSIDLDSLVREAKARTPDAAICYNYLLTGTCRNGSNCGYTHLPRKENQYCMRSGGHKSRKDCCCRHSREKPVVPPPVDFNFLGLPIRPGERECTDYMRDGVCQYGQNCGFHHPNPTVVAEGDVPFGSFSLHPVSQPASTSWSSPPNETVSYLDAANHYVPMTLPPQGVHHNSEWNGYQTNFGPCEREFPYCTCAGSCKYGPNCSFHHPDPASVREGDIPCGSFSLHSSGVSQPTSTSWSSPPNETVPYVDPANHFVPMMLPPQGVHQNLEWNGYQASLRPNGTQPLLSANRNLHSGNKPKTNPAVNGTSSKRAKKTKIEQSWSCRICKIDCNSKIVLDNHKLGKKHKENLEKLEESKKEASAPAAATAAHAAKHPAVGLKESPVAEKGKTDSVRSIWHEICMIDCESKNVLDQSKLGKKHNKNLEKLEESKKEASAPAAATAVHAAKHPVVGLKESPVADKGKTVSVQQSKEKGAPSLGPGEDLETLIVKSVWCEICNIDCKSQIVLDQHKWGKQHKKNLEKLEEPKKDASAPTAKDPVISPKESPADDEGKTQRVQYSRHEICKIDCESKNVLEQPKLGKKHNKNLEKLEESKKEASAPAAPTAAHAAKHPAFGLKEIPVADKGKTVGVQQSKEKVAPSLGPGEDPETLIVKSVWCEICNIDCKSQIVLGQHRLGKQHKKNLEKLEEPKKDASAPTAKDPIVGPKESPADDKDKTQRVQSSGCEICKIDCESKNVLDQPKLGKKHNKKLEKLEESKKEASAPAAATVAHATKHPTVGLKESPVADKGKTVSVQQSKEKGAPFLGPGEDLETLTVNSVWCEICNIDCKSQIVLDQHKLGKQHKKNLEKLEEPKKDASAPTAKDPVIGPIESPADDKGKTRRVQYSRHEICKIDCESKNVLEQLKLGKKHNEKLEESKKEASAPAAATVTHPAKHPAVGLKENPVADKGKTVGVQRSKEKGAPALGPGEVLDTLIVKSVWCEICNIDCKSQIVLDRHKLGKQHKKNLEKLEESKKDDSAPTTKDPAVGPKESPADDEGQTRCVQSSWHEICKIDCESKNVLDQPKLRKKHNKNLEKLEESKKEASAPAAATAAHAATHPEVGLKECPVADKGKTVGVQQRKEKAAPSLGRGEDLETLIVKSVWCEICKIECTSQIDLDQHKLGKKHKKNLAKLEELKREVTAPAATAAHAANHPVVGLIEYPAADKVKTVGVQQSKEKGAPSLGLGEDLNIRMMKLMEGGAAANALWLCEVCNVVCNSQTVFNDHLAGQKHANMGKKELVPTGTTNPSDPLGGFYFIEDEQL
ncbi:hypothetical protein NE237_021173 [Protea cynaroides]|uniref:C3H1-type domain-containing protein n=1 Tax=Protea cynaroides TaxID=273540 RepID=A0A9Q0K4L9_9MAGN|nr:hypothetical protein NE237_021173 [Protea cynaroides]